MSDENVTAKTSRKKTNRTDAPERREGKREDGNNCFKGTC